MCKVRFIAISTAARESTPIRLDILIVPSLESPAFFFPLPHAHCWPPSPLCLSLLRPQSSIRAGQTPANQCLHFSGIPANSTFPASEPNPPIARYFYSQLREVSFSDPAGDSKQCATSAVSISCFGPGWLVSTRSVSNALTCTRPRRPRDSSATTRDSDIHLVS